MPKVWAALVALMFFAGPPAFRAQPASPTSAGPVSQLDAPVFRIPSMRKTPAIDGVFSVDEWEDASKVFPTLKGDGDEIDVDSSSSKPKSEVEAPPSNSSNRGEPSPVKIASAGKSTTARLHRKPSGQESSQKTITIVVVLTLAIIVLGGALIYVLMQ